MSTYNIALKILLDNLKYEKSRLMLSSSSLETNTKYVEEYAHATSLAKKNIKELLVIYLREKKVFLLFQSVPSILWRILTLSELLNYGKRLKG